MNENELIQQHLKARYGWQPDIAEILSWPRYKRVWSWWEALAYLRQGDYFEKLSDAPEGLEWITVMDGERKNYKWNKGKYEYMQSLTEKDCKSIYGM